MWKIQNIFGHCTSKRMKDSEVNITFQGRNYSGWLTIAKQRRKTPAYRLWFDDDYINRGFDELVGKGKEYIEPLDVKDDISKLNERIEVLKTYVNKTVAHLDREKLEKLPTIKDLDDSIDLIVKLIQKYYAIIHAGTIELQLVS